MLRTHKMCLDGKIAVMNTFGASDARLPPGSTASAPDHIRFAAEASRIFNILSEGGQIETPLSDVAWSSAFGIVTDCFGTPWLILAMNKVCS